MRYSVGYDADPTIGNSRPDSVPNVYARPEIRAAVARLAAHGLALDAWCYHPQLADVIALARAVPQAMIVMCHVGGVLGYGAYAGKKDEVHAAWRASMAELAACPNVSVKLGGMLNRGAALNFRELPAPPNSLAWAAAWRPYVEPCIELFGAARGRAAAREGDRPPVRAALTSRVAAPGLVREGKMGKPRPASAQRPLPRAGGGAPSEIWKPAWTPIYRRGRHLGRNEDPLFRSAAGLNGTLVATAGAARALAHGPKPYDRTGDEITLDEIERIRI